MKDTESVRARFAPSPTGYLHVGGVRTALFNWLFARNKKGKFILRIEDTDRKRSTKEALDDILDSMKWLGLDWDEGPFFQSERLDIYKQYAEELIKKGCAYMGKANEGEGQAVVFAAHKDEIVVKDLVHGEIKIDASLIEDFVILKSDGMPTYNFGCVVDDALMGITHVIRGDDHISNTPRQMMIYKALEFKEPLFAHVPMILGPDGTRLSKRHGATSVSEYKKQGFLPDTLINFLALLGWSPGKNIELMDKDHLIKEFSIKRITGKSAVFNIDKLTWMNGIYISKLTDDQFVKLCLPFANESGLIKSQDDEKKLLKIIPLFKKRIKLLSDIVNAIEYFFKEEIVFNEDAAVRLNDKSLLREIKNIIENINPFETHNMETAFKGMVDRLKIQPKDLMQTTRAAVTGRTETAGIFETMEAMGKDLVQKHIKQAIEK